MLPLILYLDKTGTDVLQRYSLEPLLFTVANLKRESRECRRFWRHLGFIPSSKSIENSKESLQFYHLCLQQILAGLKHAQRNRPLIRVKQTDGSQSLLHAHVPIMIITGDQLSQDTLCCRRKANAGGAGRVHRSCMCSFTSTDDPQSTCQSVPKALLQKIIPISNMTIQDMHALIEGASHIKDKVTAKSPQSRTMKYLLRQNKLFNAILSKPFTMHSVISAFDDVDFGAWSGGVYDATFDDFMHSFEEGMMENIGSALFNGLVASESERVEAQMIPLLTKARSSARNTFPRWRIQKGFSRQTLMTMGERVGSIFSLSLALHDAGIAQLFHTGHERQRQKYQTFPVAGKAEDFPMYYEQYLHSMTMEQCKHTLTHLYRHGFDISLLETLDPFQINQLLYHASGILERLVYPDSYPEFANINGMYDDKGTHVRICPRLLNVAHTAMNLKTEHVFKKHRCVQVDGVIPKHHRRKGKQKGDGNTSAFLGTTTSSLISFLEYTLCYHAFCKYSSSLPLAMQRDTDLIDFSGWSLVTYFCKMVYRGDDTIDTRTTKIHVQRRLGHNFRSLGNVIHACCEVGERLLKTEAKKISRTAQQKGSIVFERQTCSRILDRHLFDKMGLALSDARKDSESDSMICNGKKDSFSRQQPHFIIQRQGPVVIACDRKGKPLLSDDGYHLNPLVVDKLLEFEADSQNIEVYNEVILRDGSYVRAFHNYRGEGPWFDFVNIQWEDHTGASYLLPAQCLAFYKKEGDCMAIVQSVDVDSAGRVPGYSNSVLTTHYRMQCARSGVPTLYSVNCASIDSTILAIDHDPSCDLLVGSSKRTVMIVRPRNEWAFAWYVWNQHLRIKNTNRTQTRPMVDLGTERMIEHVRRLIHQSIVAHGKV